MLYSSILVFLTLIGVVSSYNNGLGETPIMGWSTWCTNDLCGIRDRCSEWEVRNIADAVVSQGLREYGYIWMLLDDCWSDHERDANGNLQPNPYQFPSGMPALADYLHERGLKLGLYTCVGTETCKKNRPGSYGYYEQDAQTLASWGADMVKADYCNRPSNETGKDLYYQFSAALNATGRPMLFATCQWGEDNVVEWGGEVAQMYRIQMDHIPFWNWGPTAQGAGYGCGTKQIIDYMADLHPSRYSKPYAFMDPDFLMTMYEPFTMNYTNSRSEFSFWALWSAPLLVATDLKELSEQKREILTNEEVLAIHKDPLWIGGERLFNHTDGAQVWYRPLANGDMAVILFNSDNYEVVNVSVNWVELGFSPETKMTVRDVWAHADLGVYDTGFSVDLPVHDISFIRITPSTGTH